ncbi:MAG: glycosyltransferase [Thermoplasmata archaeon]|nr:MAG: glycosyltransferase [Thermoplasmata archaeon]
MKVLYGVCSWGLGHATRSLPIMRKLIDEGNEVTVTTTGRSLDLLKMELKDSANYYDSSDYPLPYTDKSKVFLLKFCWFAPKLIKSMIEEHRRMSKYIENNNFDIIISDNRYGIFHKKIPSFLITHQLRVIAPGRLKMIENSWERFNVHFTKYFKNIMVPDYEENGISGDLSHNLNHLNSKNIVYFGIMSDFKKRDVSEDVDFLFSISGPEPQRQVMEDLVFRQVNEIDGNIIMSLGRTFDSSIKKKKDELADNIKLYDFLPAEERELLMSRSRIIISRSGYSTLMDIYALEKKAMFIPTPQQTEQEYLAKHHEERGNFLYVNQKEIDLPNNLMKAKNYSGPDKKYEVAKNTEKFLSAIHT